MSPEPGTTELDRLLAVAEEVKARRRGAMPPPVRPRWDDSWDRFIATTELPAEPVLHEPELSPARRSVYGTLATAGGLVRWVGILVVLFVAFQLWGTDYSAARSQRELRASFARTLPPSPASPQLASTTPVTAALPASSAPVVQGRGVAILRIPRIGLDKVVVEGVSRSDLAKGPGHYRGTPLPGEPGNAAIAAHRTTYGAPFRRLDDLDPGDEILVTTRAGHSRYVVRTKLVVDPSDSRALHDTLDNRLTLTTCTPPYSARNRLAVIASLVGTPLLPSAAPVVDGQPPPDDAAAGAVPIEMQEMVGGAAGGEWPGAVAWGAVTLLLVHGLVLGWQRLRLVGRVVMLVPASPVVAIALFWFFDGATKLLPASF